MTIVHPFAATVATRYASATLAKSYNAKGLNCPVPFAQFCTSEYFLSTSASTGTTSQAWTFRFIHSANSSPPLSISSFTFSDIATSPFVISSVIRFQKVGHTSSGKSFLDLMKTLVSKRYLTSRLNNYIHEVVVGFAMQPSKAECVGV